MAALICSAALLIIIVIVMYPQDDAAAVYGEWQYGHASLYGDSVVAVTGGACGYGNLYSEAYGANAAALSSALFNNGLTCGACYEIECNDEPERCKPGSIIVTATNLCPPNSALPNNTGLCNPPLKHLKMSETALLQIAKYKAGTVRVKFRRVPCVKIGGIKFTIRGHSCIIRVLITNVAGAGDVHAVAIKGSGTGWQPMSRNWGQIWEINSCLNGRSLCFQVTTSDGRTVTCNNVAPDNWQFGQAFEGCQFQ